MHEAFWNEIRTRAAKFTREWADAAYEKSETQADSDDFDQLSVNSLGSSTGGQSMLNSSQILCQVAAPRTPPAMASRSSTVR